MAHSFLVPLKLILVMLFAVFVPLPEEILRARQTLGWGWLVTDMTPIRALMACILILLGWRSGFPRDFELRAQWSYWFARFFAVSGLAFVGWMLVQSQLAETLIVTGVFSGLIVAAVLPTAGSAAGWILHANADGKSGTALILYGTVLSLFVTPLMLNAIEYWCRMMASETALSFSEVASAYQVGLAIPWILFPLLLGATLHGRAFSGLTDWMSRRSSTLSFFFVLALNYINASGCLPRFFEEYHPVWCLMVMTLCIVTCTLLSLAGSRIARWFGLEERVCLSVGITTAMSNTGIGLVLLQADERFDQASPTLTLAASTLVLLTLCQHLTASFLVRSGADQGPFSEASRAERSSS